MPRFGRLYASAVLRPLAEQLVDALHVRAGDTVCDVMCDGGELALALAARVGAGGHVVAADTDAALSSAVVRSVRHLGVDAAAIDLSATDVTHARTCDAAACLFTGGFAPEVVRAMSQLLRPGGRALLACWDPDAPPPHEDVLAEALHDAGLRSPFLEAVLRPPLAPSAGDVVRDVVRFDGFAAYWTALVSERPLGDELTASTPELLADVRDRCRRRLRRYEAADETLRIPVSARFVAL